MHLRKQIMVNADDLRQYRFCSLECRRLLCPLATARSQLGRTDPPVRPRSRHRPTDTFEVSRVALRNLMHMRKYRGFRGR